ncbi:hypothetical protein AWENTII_010869 [Aspergillus wentii]
MWEEREHVQAIANRSADRFSHYTDEVKDSISQFDHDNQGKAINWNVRLDKEIETLESSLNRQCLQNFRMSWYEYERRSDIDEETEALVKPHVDKVDAKFCEYRDKTVESLKRRRREGFSGGWDVQAWYEEYKRYLDDLQEYIAHMNDDVNDESD